MVAEVPRTLAAVVEALLMVEVVEPRTVVVVAEDLRMVAAVAALTVIAKTNKTREFRKGSPLLKAAGLLSS